MQIGWRFGAMKPLGLSAYAHAGPIFNPSRGAGALARLGSRGVTDLLIQLCALSVSGALVAFNISSACVDNGKACEFPVRYSYGRTSCLPFGFIVSCADFVDPLDRELTKHFGKYPFVRRP